ncbi:glycoside hydrolase family 99-like domain-containing protein [Flagellimonas amoyensis]|uniref:glycosyltransferase WbsX family protein n=1 Tax=Flagellimonas amoyensis TaxID=2169401 RepID=UPI00190115E4|nr:glycoside hydrolase family 99-like domain-containing protein [Allomuricauda amoyensis]
MKGNYSLTMKTSKALYLVIILNWGFFQLGMAQKKDSDYKVAAYYWPAYHNEPRWRTFFDGREGEWEIIHRALPKYEGHRQPRVPVWGYEDETNPKVMEKKIDAAVSHGVNVFIFDWYWYEEEPFLEKTINDGFLKAKNNDKIDFYIMWANHAATTLWDKRRSHKMDTIWNGEVDRKNFNIVTDRIIEKYMKHPSYLKIDGKPVFSIYELGTLIQGLGGIEETKDALDSFREKVKNAGFPGLHLQAILWSNIPDTKSNVPGDNAKTQNNTIEVLGINSLTNYQFVHVSSPVDNYLDWANKAVDKWQDWDNEFSVPFFPHVAVDWDTNSRFYDYKPNIKEGVNPTNFKKYLIKAKSYMDKHPQQYKLMTINSWNEWSEGSYLEPDTEHGYGYLEAIKAVFGSN